MEAASRNPFTVPPSRMTLEQFQIQHPFLCIINDSVIIDGREDKVRDGKFMDDAALMAAILAMQPTAGLFNRAFKSPSSEIGGRPHHIALASGFWLVTEPHEQRRFSSLEEFTQQSKKDESSSEPESQQDLKITLKKVSCSGGESNESLDIKQEGDGGENAEAKVRYDFNFMIYDNTLKGSDNKVSALIVDATWSNLSMNKMCQVSSYGCKYAIKNMEKGRYAPLYVELWGEDRWRYGILYMKGTVVLEDGKVVATTSNYSSFEALESTLQNTKRTYKKTIKSFTYPDGTYVEGWLYIPNEKFSLPNTSGSNIEDIQCFYQSKIRIIAGDKALQLKEDEVKKRVATRLSTFTGAENLARSWQPMADNKRLKPLPR